MAQVNALISVLTFITFQTLTTVDCQFKMQMVPWDNDETPTVQTLFDIVISTTPKPESTAATTPEPTTTAITNLAPRHGIVLERRVGVGGENTTEQTPDSFPNSGFGKGYGGKCNFYGAEFFQAEKTSVPPMDKAVISSQLCRLSLRLECVPTSRQRPIVPQVTDPPVANMASAGGPDESISLSARRAGICLCARSLGDRAVFIRGDKNMRSGCFIPAGYAHASLCGQEVALPYGIIDNGTITRLTFGPSINLCVPNAECRIGYTYVGLRCACKKGTIWLRQNGTCVPEPDGSRVPGSTGSRRGLNNPSTSILHALFTVIAFLIVIG